jgi:hypothetical protein
MWWDLRRGAAVKLVEGHNSVGSGQPDYERIREGVGEVTCWNASTMGIHIQIDGAPMCLGQWWIDAAIRGGPSTLPIVNTNPEVIIVIDE